MQKIKNSVIFATIGFMTACFATNGSAEAADAEWGCQIVLCAASQNPSWHGVPYCIPPMRKLITAMAKPGFSWPICTAAGTGKPHYERYDDCPAGYTPSSSNNGEHSSGELNQCSRPKHTCGGWGGGHDGSCSDVETIARPLKSKPYYFDIPQKAGPAQRFWFDLTH